MPYLQYSVIPPLKPNQQELEGIQQLSLHFFLVRTAPMHVGTLQQSHTLIGSIMGVLWLNLRSKGIPVVNRDCLWIPLKELLMTTFLAFNVSET